MCRHIYTHFSCGCVGMTSITCNKTQNELYILFCEDYDCFREQTNDVCHHTHFPEQFQRPVEPTTPPQGRSHRQSMDHASHASHAASREFRENSDLDLNLGVPRGQYSPQRNRRTRSFRRQGAGHFASDERLDRGSGPGRETQMAEKEDKVPERARPTRQRRRRYVGGPEERMRFREIHGYRVGTEGPALMRERDERHERMMREAALAPLQRTALGGDGYVPGYICGPPLGAEAVGMSHSTGSGTDVGIGIGIGIGEGMRAPGATERGHHQPPVPFMGQVPQIYGGYATGAGMTGMTEPAFGGLASSGPEDTIFVEGNAEMEPFGYRVAQW